MKLIPLFSIKHHFPNSSCLLSLSWIFFLCFVLFYLFVFLHWDLDPFQLFRFYPVVRKAICLLGFPDSSPFFFFFFFPLFIRFLLLSISFCLSAFIHSTYTPIHKLFNKFLSAIYVTEIVLISRDIMGKREQVCVAFKGTLKKKFNENIDSNI